MDTRIRRFISIGAMTCGAIVFLVGMFNVIVDPYRLFGRNSLEPATRVNDRVFKSYEALRVAPNALLLGSSRVEEGLDARHPDWPMSVRPVYNLGLIGASPYLSYRYLQHVLSHRPLKLVVMGLDFGFFLDSFKEPTPIEPDDEPRLTVKPDGSANPEQGRAYVRDVLRSLSLKALVDSTATIARGISDDPGYDANGDLLFNGVALRERAAQGAIRTFPLNDLWFIRLLRAPGNSGGHIDPRVMLTLRDILQLCDSHGTRVIFFINPVHADLLEILASTGLWPTFEDWKRQLTALTHEYSRAHTRSRISLWDFSGYHDYATEAVSWNHQLLKGFVDPSHYNWVVGDVIIRQIFGQQGARMGTELTPQTVETYLATIRKQQQEYRDRQPLDVQRVHLLYKGLVDTIAP